jgi:hypothetical protein
MKRLAAVCAVALTALGIGAAAAQPPTPYGPVPEPRYEPVPPPRPGRYWEPGHWHWNGYPYVWVDGRYIGGPPRYGAYIPGHWRWNGYRYVWAPAHWG